MPHHPAERLTRLALLTYFAAMALFWGVMLAGPLAVLVPWLLGVAAVSVSFLLIESIGLAAAAAGRRCARALIKRTASGQCRAGVFPAGICPTCGYDLRETRTRCPECGAVP